MNYLQYTILKSSTHLRKFRMSSKEREVLKERIKRAIEISSQKLIEKKKALGQKLVISEDGKIRIVEP